MSFSYFRNCLAVSSSTSPTHYTYCMSEGTDVRRCCQRRKLPKQCLQFCQGDRDPLACDSSLSDVTADCPRGRDDGTREGREIGWRCYFESLSTTEMKWDVNWKPPNCDE